MQKQVFTQKKKVSFFPYDMGSLLEQEPALAKADFDAMLLARGLHAFYVHSLAADLRAAASAAEAGVLAGFFYPVFTVFTIVLIPKGFMQYLQLLQHQNSLLANYSTVDSLTILLCPKGAKILLLFK